MLIDDEVRRGLEELESLAPLHNAPAVRAIANAEQALPDVPHVAVFDTAFHATIPDVAATYALPQRWRDLGIRRYGFHGLSVQWCAERVPVPRLVVCHLGGGSSITAVRNGRSVDTTMGFSPLEGVPMTTRSGSVDPGAIVHLLRAHGVDAETLEDELNFESGLKALSGGSGDIREVDDFARDVFAYRVAAAAGAMAVALDGIDALAFTAGIGEHSARVRECVCARLGFLGVELDAEANVNAEPDAVISKGATAVHVVKAREEIVAARAARALLG